MTQPITNVDLTKLAEKLSTRQRKVVQTNALNARTKEKWDRIGRKVFVTDVKHTSFYV